MVRYPRVGALLVLGSHLAPGLPLHGEALLLLLSGSNNISLEPCKGFLKIQIHYVCGQHVSEAGFSFCRSHTDSFVMDLIYLHVLWSCSLQNLPSHQGWISVSLAYGAQVFPQSSFCGWDLYHRSFGITAVCLADCIPWRAALQFHVRVTSERFSEYQPALCVFYYLLNILCVAFFFNWMFLFSF